jgi:hypothetical protein
MNPHAYDPERERQWAEQRHACLLREFIANPELANHVLAALAQHWQPMPDRRDPTREAYGLRLRADLAEWIAADPKEGANLLDRWDRIQVHTRREGTDPNYARAIRLEARKLWAQRQPIGPDSPAQEQTQWQEST